nr:MAG TPA: hypothetical protein [Caudoviricetes sp.]
MLWKKSLELMGFATSAVLLFTLPAVMKFVIGTVSATKLVICAMRKYGILLVDAPIFLQNSGVFTWTK